MIFRSHRKWRYILNLSVTCAQEDKRGDISSVLQRRTVMNEVLFQGEALLLQQGSKMENSSITDLFPPPLVHWHIFSASFRTSSAKLLKPKDSHISCLFLLNHLRTAPFNTSLKIAYFLGKIAIFLLRFSVGCEPRGFRYASVNMALMLGCEGEGCSWFEMREWVVKWLRKESLRCFPLAFIVRGLRKCEI